MLRLFHSSAVDDGDLALVDRVLAGDEAAFDIFFEGQLPGLYHFALSRLHDCELSREIVQAALCSAIDRLETYRGESSLAAWLFTICRNEISAHFRRERRQPLQLPEQEDGELGIAGTAPGQDTLLEQKESADRVHRALEQLPTRYGLVLSWKYVDELPVVEIARRLRLRPKAAESLLTRARQAFREVFRAFASPIGPAERGSR
jgi:RNA polymerase sigma-70 factor (ECF subfamily)